MKIINLVGARPQFIKAAVVSKVIAKNDEISEVIVHTGQHYDENMSKIFFDELNIPHPNYNLGVGSASHGKQTALILERFEEILEKEKPQHVILYGDTNSTIAGALAATKLHIPVSHVEAGLRSFNRNMPEEINRIATDHISDKLFAPSINAMNILKTEGLEDKSYFSGDVMFDSILYYKEVAKQRYFLNEITDLDEFYLATVHRAENTDNPKRLKNIFRAFSKLDSPVLLPLHPRTKRLIKDIKITNVRIINPVSYLELIILMENSKKILTDSGGIQKEAFFMKKPCITLRDETEWIETLNGNWNYIVGAEVDQIIEKVENNNFSDQQNYYGDGSAGEKIIQEILKI